MIRSCHKAWQSFLKAHALPVPSYKVLALNPQLQDALTFLLPNDHLSFLGPLFLSSYCSKALSGHFSQLLPAQRWAMPAAMPRALPVSQPVHVLCFCSAVARPETPAARALGSTEQPTAAIAFKMQPNTPLGSTLPSLQKVQQQMASGHLHLQPITPTTCPMFLITPTPDVLLSSLTSLNSLVHYFNFFWAQTHNLLPSQDVLA